jgi:hypothetical protein
MVSDNAARTSMVSSGTSTIETMPENVVSSDWCKETVKKPMELSVEK